MNLECTFEEKAHNISALVAIMKYSEPVTFPSTGLSHNVMVVHKGIINGLFDIKQVNVK